MEAEFAQAAAEEKLQQVKVSQKQPSETSNVTISSIGRRLPPRPAWARSEQEATMANQVAAASLADLPKGKK